MDMETVIADVILDLSSLNGCQRNSSSAKKTLSRSRKQAIAGLPKLNALLSCNLLHDSGDSSTLFQFWHVLYLSQEGKWTEG